MYWYLNKEDNKPGIYTSLTAITANEGIPYERLKYHFTRKKRSNYEDKDHRIERLSPITSKRK